MGIYGASVFGGSNDPSTGSTGYRGDNLNQKPNSFAELNMGKSLGNLPYMTAARVTNLANGKSMVLYKRDIGAGGGPLNGHARGIDIWHTAAGQLGINGSAAVKVTILNGAKAGKSMTTTAAGNTAQSLVGGRSPAPAGRQQLLAQYLLQRGNPDAMLNLAQGMKSSQAPAQAAKPSVSPASTAKGIGTFEGAKVSAWIVPELQYARAHGWTGKVTSGYRSYADQARIYNSGVRPAAKPGQSNHERTGYLQGAVDVTDQQTLSRVLQQKGSRLQWAGQRDPVHFSVPRNGSY